MIPIAEGWPADAVQRVALKSLVPYQANARTHSAAQIDQIAASIREWGWTVPVLVDEKGEVIAGHGRLLAAEKLGLADVPVMTAKGWTQKQIKAYRLADNQLALNAAWDVKLLAAELGELDRHGRSDRLFRGPIAGDPRRPPGLDRSRRGAAAAGRAGEPGRRSVDLRQAPDSVRRCHRCRRRGAAAGRREAESDGDRSALWRELRSRLARTVPILAIGERSKGKVPNDDRMDWREAWALFPGDIAYVWHAGRHASAVQQSLESAGLHDPLSDHLGQTAFRDQPRRLPLAARALLVCRSQKRLLGW